MNSFLERLATVSRDELAEGPTRAVKAAIARAHAAGLPTVGSAPDGTIVVTSPNGDVKPFYAPIRPKHYLYVPIVTSKKRPDQIKEQIKSLAYSGVKTKQLQFVPLHDPAKRDRLAAGAFIQVRDLKGGYAQSNLTKPKKATDHSPNRKGRNLGR